MNKSIYIFDKSLIPRIQKYLDDNVQNEYISIDVMADYLQKSYRDYTRRNRNAFHKSVHDAYAVIMKNYGISESEVIACTDSSDLEEVETPQNQSTDLVDMYMKNTPKESDDNSPRLNVITPRIEGIKIRGKKRRIESDIKSIETAVSKKKAKDIRVPLVPEVTFNDIAGMNRIMEELGMLLLHMKRPEIYREIGELPPRGILLHGPVGCGKTLLAHAIAGELKVTLLKVSAPELVAGVAGESEERIRELFQKAKNASPCVLFIDQIDAISQSRQHAQKEMERRIVAQLLTCFDDLNKDKSADQILVIGATNRADGLDSALRREGRFDTELCLGVPDFEARIRILKILTEKLKLSEDFNYETVAKLTPGYVGADLVALKKRATLFAIKRISLEKLQGNENALTERNLLNEVAMWWDKDLNEQGKKGVDKIFIELEDFLKAVKVVQPSSKREGFATVPNITWDDIGSLADIRQELQLTILASIRYTKECESLGITASTGVLLCGPPGCGKTLLAKAIANEAGINFISVKGPELLNMYVGESERAVRQCFARARTSAPCVIFFDELDALCPKRSDSRENNASSRVVNQMLTEMDGVEERLGVYILAASNRPDIVDPAILRPGRLDKILYVGLPTPEDRVDILKTITKNGTRPKLDSNVDLDIVGSSSILEGYTGADLAALVHEASTEALKEIMTCSGNSEECAQVSLRHFKRAAAKIRPSVNEKDRKQYEKLKERYGTKSSRKEAEEIDF